VEVKGVSIIEHPASGTETETETGTENTVEENLAARV
jgi:hypothetical protein